MRLGRRLQLLEQVSSRRRRSPPLWLHQQPCHRYRQILSDVVQFPSSNDLAGPLSTICKLTLRRLCGYQIKDDDVRLPIMAYCTSLSSLVPVVKRIIYQVQYSSLNRLSVSSAACKIQHSVTVPQLSDLQGT
ncbi:hypothetical protein RvY_12368 [Ramazzottius varieornatus]|uniref:Uncharacterized protein n=1 Tax=Ramazzottius varieornatus TaxID=947166 RepID=A0A1D1VPP9_RAMVA|nr:hypothetical protein RvY_12368 [Ramazzottius varieornatus]